MQDNTEHDVNMNHSLSKAKLSCCIMVIVFIIIPGL